MKCLVSFLIISCLAFGSNGQKVDSVAQKVDTVSHKTNKFAIYPAIGISPETGVQLGSIAFFVLEDKLDDGINRASSITPLFIYTTENQVLTLVDFDYYFKNGNNANTAVRYFDFPDKYYGIGPSADPDEYDRYTDRFFRLDGRFTKPLNKYLFTGVYYDVQYNEILDYDQGRLLATDSPNGLKGGRNIGVGPGMQYDTRNSTLYPTDGKLINLGVTIFSEAFGSEYNYQLYLIDYRQYFEFLGPKNIVAFQYRSRLTSGTDIPFYKLNRLAGDERLRGIGHKNLYRDRQSMYFQVEGRQELFWRFGGVIFAGIGQVFDDFSNFKVRNSRFVYGLGGRFQAIKGQKMNIRMDLGFSDEGQMAFYLSVREAF